jgi:hypothetical protein
MLEESERGAQPRGLSLISLELNRNLPFDPLAAAGSGRQSQRDATSSRDAPPNHYGCKILLSLRSLALVAIAWFIVPGLAEAGMPSLTLSDLPTRRTLTHLVQMRLEVISFFSLVLLLSAAAIRWIWNGLRKDFPRIPRLSYTRAVGLVMIWGLLFLLVLTMISGARELMTPGAWEKKGFTYQLAPELTPEAQREVARYQGIDRLRLELDRLQDNRSDAPGSRLGFSESELAQIPNNAWIIPGSTGLRYLYVANAPREYEAPIALEPEGVGPFRLVVVRSGAIRSMTTEEIEHVLKKHRTQ